MTASLDEVLARVKHLETLVLAVLSVSGFASDADVDGAKGDPVVKITLKSWRGPNCAGKKYSQCPPEFLEALAELLMWMADNPQQGKEKYAVYNRIDAGRARKWALRMRLGQMKAPAAKPEPPRNPFMEEPKPNSPEDIGFAKPAAKAAAPALPDDDEEDEDDDGFAAPAAPATAKADENDWEAGRL